VISPPWWSTDCQVSQARSGCGVEELATRFVRQNVQKVQVWLGQAAVRMPRWGLPSARAGSGCAAPRLGRDASRPAPRGGRAQARAPPG